MQAIFTSFLARTSRLARVFWALAAIVVALVMAASAAHASNGDKSGAHSTEAGKPIPGQYIVTVDKGVDPQALAKKHDAKLKHVYRDALNGFAAQLNDRQVEALRHNPHVTAIEQDQVATADATQYTNANGDPWGLDRIDERTLPMTGYYTYGSSGSGVRAYVIDTGIQTSHSQFGGRAMNVYDALNGNGQDCNGHGTHVAGTIGGSTYGVAKQSQLRGVRVLDCSGYGSYSGIIAGVDWVRANAIRPAVVNMSLGGSYSSALNQAVTNLTNSGVFVAVAAGNENTSACTKSPASAAGTFTVAASSKTDARASFSNYGSCVDGYAPGVSILSAALGGGAQYMNGTSMASPHVAGVVALAEGVYGDYSSSAWVNWLTSTATTNVIQSNPSGTPNRLVYKGTL